MYTPWLGPRRALRDRTRRPSKRELVRNPSRAGLDDRLLDGHTPSSQRELRLGSFAGRLRTSRGSRQRVQRKHDPYSAHDMNGWNVCFLGRVGMEGVLLPSRWLRWRRSRPTTFEAQFHDRWRRLALRCRNPALGLPLRATSPAGPPTEADGPRARHRGPSRAGRRPADTTAAPAPRTTRRGGSSPGARAATPQS